MLVGWAKPRKIRIGATFVPRVDPEPAVIADPSEEEIASPRFKESMRRADALARALEKRVRKGCRCTYCTRAKASR